MESESIAKAQSLPPTAGSGPAKGLQESNLCHKMPSPLPRPEITSYKVKNAHDYFVDRQGNTRLAHRQRRFEVFQNHYFGIGQFHLQRVELVKESEAPLTHDAAVGSVHAQRGHPLQKGGQFAARGGHGGGGDVHHFGAGGVGEALVADQAPPSPRTAFVQGGAAGRQHLGGLVSRYFPTHGYPEHLVVVVFGVGHLVRRHGLLPEPGLVLEGGLGGQEGVVDGLLQRVRGNAPDLGRNGHQRSVQHAAYQNPRVVLCLDGLGVVELDGARAVVVPESGRVVVMVAQVDRVHSSAVVEFHF